MDQLRDLPTLKPVNQLMQPMPFNVPTPNPPVWEVDGSNSAKMLMQIPDDITIKQDPSWNAVIIEHGDCKRTIEFPLFAILVADMSKTNRVPKTYSEAIDMLLSTTNPGQALGGLVRALEGGAVGAPENGGIIEGFFENDHRFIAGVYHLVNTHAHNTGSSRIMSLVEEWRSRPGSDSSVPMAVAVLMEAFFGENDVPKFKIPRGLVLNEVRELAMENVGTNVTVDAFVRRLDRELDRMV